MQPLLKSLVAHEYLGGIPQLPPIVPRPLGPGGAPVDELTYYSGRAEDPSGSPIFYAYLLDVAMGRGAERASSAPAGVARAGGRAIKESVEDHHARGADGGQPVVDEARAVQAIGLGVIDQALDDGRRGEHGQRPHRARQLELLSRIESALEDVTLLLDQLEASTEAWQPWIERVAPDPEHWVLPGRYTLADVRMAYALETVLPLHPGLVEEFPRLHAAMLRFFSESVAS